jgi:hypothetical protein
VTTSLSPPEELTRGVTLAAEFERAEGLMTAQNPSPNPLRPTVKFENDCASHPLKPQQEWATTDTDTGAAPSA